MLVGFGVSSTHLDYVGYVYKVVPPFTIAKLAHITWLTGLYRRYYLYYIIVTGEYCGATLYSHLGRNYHLGIFSFLVTSHGQSIGKKIQSESKKQQQKQRRQQRQHLLLQQSHSGISLKRSHKTMKISFEKTEIQKMITLDRRSTVKRSSQSPSRKHESSIQNLPVSGGLSSPHGQFMSIHVNSRYRKTPKTLWCDSAFRMAKKLGYQHVS